ncbi:MAG: hypothetical protein KC609_05970 [Myxococcales bacterium]|nr:hypothetical protein [Myxococcales bacterium]
MKKFTLSICALAIVSLATTTAFAQSQNDPAPNRPGEIQRPFSGLKRLLIQKVIDELQLTRTQGQTLIPLVERTIQQKRALFVELRAIQAKLQTLVSQTPVDQAAIRAQIQLLERLHAKHLAQRAALITSVKSILTVEQQARLVLLVPKMRQRAHQFMQRFGGLRTFRFHD